ncbi:MAG: glycosyltransferase [Thermoplasmata archaeon]|nr:MAG: glycosyltransferase [Thermoplasmata archaeon]
MKILLATESYHPNIDGGAIARRNLAIRLKKRGHEVGVVAPGFRLENYEEYLDGIRIFRVAGRTLPIYTDYKFCVYPLREVKRIIKEFEPDVIDMNSPYPIGVSTLTYGKKMGIPVIGTIHVQPENMLLTIEKAKFLFRILEKLAWLYIINVFNRCDYVTSPTQTAIDMLRSNGLKTKAKAISSGIDLNLFNPANNGDYLRKRYDIPNKPVVLYTGRISGEKRLDVMIRAIPSVLDSIDAHFVICGEGREKENIENLVKKMDVYENVTFTGFLPNGEFPDIYSIADLFAIPSESELQSIVTMEALASGLPVVASNKDALPELVQNPENGLLFNPGDSEALSQKIVEILKDDVLKRSMGETSLEIVQKHSIENTISQFESLYNEAIDTFNSKRGH